MIPGGFTTDFEHNCRNTPAGNRKNAFYPGIMKIVILAAAMLLAAPALFAQTGQSPPADHEHGAHQMAGDEHDTHSMVEDEHAAHSMAGDEHEAHSMDGDEQNQHEGHVHQETPATYTAEEVGVTEKLGEKIPLDAVFLDENGNRLALSEFIDRPTLILPIFYYCPQACSIMLGNLAESLGKIPLQPGKDFRIIAFSFNHDETPEDARRSKENYARLLPEDFPLQEWKYLTGDADSIRAFTDAIGFRFKQLARHDFVHPNMLLAVSPEGSIIRYLYGLSWLPFDMGMALTEASRGMPSLSVRRLLTYCFSYEPEKKTYTFRAVRFIALGIVLVMGIFLFFLLRGRKPGESPEKE